MKKNNCEKNCEKKCGEKCEKKCEKSPMDLRRVFVIVLDSVGAGELPDAAAWGDAGANTLRSISASPEFRIDNLRSLGIGNITGLDFLGKTDRPRAAFAKMAERSQGKDTTIGHWELAGLYSPRPLPTYPDGFPEELLEEFSRRTGRGWLCNKPYSGTEVIKDYGERHMKTGDLIVYTSADSVWQIAAHEDVVPVEQLYEYCRIARDILRGEHGVGRVIARPFVGTCAADFTRTSNRHDFSLEPPGRTMLEAVSEAGMDCISVGKINDIFVGRGVTESIPTHGNEDGMKVTMKLAKRDFHGLCFVNLVDFDMLYGHRQDREGYASAMTAFDRWLPGFLSLMGEDDAVIITADHGCDPCDDSTDHTREYIPMLAYGRRIYPVNLGVRGSFADIAATVCGWLGAELDTMGESFAADITAGENELCPGTGISDEELVALAKKAMSRAYAPYSGCKVGAALLAKDGRVFLGCNIENAAFSPTNCAERTAFFKAVSEGACDFDRIAVAGGRDGIVTGMFAPCGVCRQVMREFCDPKKFIVLMAHDAGFERVRLEKLLPYGFSKDSM